MKRVLFVGLLMVVLGLALTSSAATPSRANAIVAIVDDEVITAKDVEQEVRLAVEAKFGLFPNRTPQVEKEIQKAQAEAVEILVERKLILQEFKRAGYNLPDSLIEDRVRDRLREDYGGDRTAMARDLQAKGTTPERLRQQERERFIVAVMRSKNIFQEIVDYRCF